MPNPLTPDDYFDLDVTCVECFEVGYYRYAPGVGYVCSSCRSEARRADEPPRKPYYYKGVEDGE